MDPLIANALAEYPFPWTFHHESETFCRIEAANGATVLAAERPDEIAACALIVHALQTMTSLLRAATAYRQAKFAGELASVLEDSGDPVERSSDSWFEEASAAEQQLFDQLEYLSTTRIVP